MPAITSYPVTGDNAKAFRALTKFGMNLADFAGLTTSSSFDAFGNGTGYTVGNWISDGVFADLAAAQAVYPIIQDANDHVDWVLLQSAVDFLLFGALGSSNFKNTKRKLFIPAGKFLINRTLHIGYGSMGTPPGDLNSNEYVSISLEGEGRQVDTSGNGMTGTAIVTEAYTYPGIVLSGYQTVQLRGFTVDGPGTSWLATNIPIYDTDVWDRAAWRDPAISDDENWIAGDEVNIGIGFDLYTDGTAAAAYPARILPAAYGGGTSTAVSGTAGGTTVEIEDVKVQGYVIGIGRPHGDNNGEFYRLNNVDVAFCAHGFVLGASQARNCNLTNVNFEGMHTAISNVGGLRGTANLHGTYSNIHFGRVFQLFDHQNADWSGPFTLRDAYAESFMRLGSWGSGRATLDSGYFSFAEQDGQNGVPYNHYECGQLVLDKTTCTGLRHGLMGIAEFTNNAQIEISNGSTISYGQAKNWDGHANETDIDAGVAYMRGIFHRVGGASRRFHSDSTVSADGYDNNWHNRSEFSFIDQQFTSFYAGYPMGGYPISGSNEMFGSVQRFPVPKLTKVQFSTDVTSRSGFDLTCPRNAIGDIKADVGDVFALYPNADGSKARVWTWFVCVSISGSNMVLRQLSNFDSTSSSNYVDNGLAQVGSGSAYLAEYVCTRVRQNRILFVGDVTSGSAVISNVRYAFEYGTTDRFNDTNFDMAAGDYFLHQEIERSLSTGGVKVPNLVSSIDYSANTITLTENFNITKVAYPIVFYVKVFNA